VRKLLFLIAVVVLLTVGAFFIAWDRFTSFLASPSARAATQEKVVMIPSGTTPHAVVDLLAKEGLIQSPDWLHLYVDHFAQELIIQPGEYQLATSMSPVELFRRITSGKVITYTVAIPPGSDAMDIARLLAQAGLQSEEELLRVAYDRHAADQMNVPSFSLEGYLFPDAYDLPKNLSATALLGLLVQRYHKTVLESVLQSARQRSLSENETVTLASIIEKSDVPQNERRLYSALLHNRLRAKVALESAPSVAYGLKRIGVAAESAKKQQLDHPWNTELNLGLPPTPICSPSLASIVAAAEPAQSRAMYMVRRKDGTHVFCDDDDCYLAALREWQPDQLSPRRRRMR
jgi:UPF0755 protein